MGIFSVFKEESSNSFILKVSASELIENSMPVVIEKAFNKISEAIAEDYLKLHGAEILASMDTSLIKDMARVQVASKIYAEMASMVSGAAPFSKWVPEYVEKKKKEIASLVGDKEANNG